MKNNLNNIEKIISDIDDVSSVRECTGLIPRGPVNDAEYENYMELMKFSAKDIETHGSL